MTFNGDSLLYDRNECGVGIFHLGIGAFHRGHQAVYIDRLLSREGRGDWRITGVSLRSQRVRELLAQNDNLFTVVESDGTGERRQIIGSIANVLVAQQEVARTIAGLAAPTTHLITMTVTEKGYCHDPTTGSLAVNDPAVRHDMAYPSNPQTAPGLLVASLARRRAQGSPPPTVISCDNIASNGELLKSTLVALAGANDSSLADWIARYLATPNTMVDRIVPATTSADIEALQRTAGYRDEAMVRTEPFSQWVIQDDFRSARPDLEAVGVLIVRDIKGFETAKLRMLNASHSFMAYTGLQLGYQYVHEAVSDPAIRLAIQHLMQEAAPSVAKTAGLDPASYARDLLLRFENPDLCHDLAQIARDGSQKLAQRVLATLVDRHSKGEGAPFAALGIATWISFLVDADRAKRKVEDPRAETLVTAVRLGGSYREIAGRLLKDEAIFGTLGAAPGVVEAVTAALDILLSTGPRAAIDEARRLCARMRGGLG